MTASTRSGPGVSLLRFAALALCLVLAGCAAPDPDGIGGTGVQAQADPDGIGGTGASPDPDGVGGSGWQAQAIPDPDGIGGTGIVGIVTALGSIQVNGTWLTVPASARISVDGRPATVEALRPGQVVEALAQQRSGTASATEVQVWHALVGPVEQVDALKGEAILMGQRLRLPVGSPRLQVGDRLRVSGQWQGNGELWVSAIGAAAADEPDAAYGPAGALHAAPGLLPPSHAATASGGMLSITGRWRPGGLEVRRVEPRPALPFPGRVRKLSLSGFAGPGTRIDALTRSPAAGVTPLHTRLAAAAGRGERVLIGADVSSTGLELRSLQAPPRGRWRLVPSAVRPLTPSLGSVPARRASTPTVVLPELPDPVTPAVPPGSLVGGERVVPTPTPTGGVRDARRVAPVDRVPIRDGLIRR